MFTTWKAGGGGSEKGGEPESYLLVEASLSLILPTKHSFALGEEQANEKGNGSGGGGRNSLGSLSLSFFFITTMVLYFFIFWLHCTACRILVPQPGIEPVPLAVEMWTPNHWTTGEFPWGLFYKGTNPFHEGSTFMT